MKKRNGRIEAILGEIMPIAHAVGNPLSFDTDLGRLQTHLYNLLCERDEEAFQAVLETFRKDSGCLSVFHVGVRKAGCNFNGQEWKSWPDILDAKK